MNLQDQLEKLRHRRDLLTILLFLFVIIVFWIGIGIFSSQQKSGISAEQRKVSQPLNPSLDTSVIEKLELKEQYSLNDLRDFSIFVVTDSQGQAVLVDTREGAGNVDVVLPPSLEGQLQELEQSVP